MAAFQRKTHHSHCGMETGCLHAPQQSLPPYIGRLPPTAACLPACKAGIRWQIQQPALASETPTIDLPHCLDLELTPALAVQEEAELTEGEYELEDELEDMEDLAEASGQDAASDEEDEDDDADADAEQAGRRRKAPVSGATATSHLTGAARNCLEAHRHQAAPRGSLSKPWV